MKDIFENWRKFVSEDVDPKMKKYLKKHPYMEPDQLQEEAAGQCFPFAVEMASGGITGVTAGFIPIGATGPAGTTGNTGPAGLIGFEYS